MNFKTKLLLGLLCMTSSLYAQRSVHLLNKEWKFRFSHQVEKNSPQSISLPHTWNAQDALVGKIDYKRGIGNYERNLHIQNNWQGKRLFLRFKGVNNIANVFMNGVHVGEHRGGYSAFVFEITDRVKYGADNKLLVRVNNAEQFDILPLVGDFNFYGGIYRDVELIVTDQSCISPLDYASPGVYLTQQQVNEKEARVEARVLVSHNGANKQAKVKVAVHNGEKEVLCQEQTLSLQNGQQEVKMPLVMNNPHLWNGRQDPFLYRVEVTLWADNKEIDRVEQPLGLRAYRVDPNQGFFLNGKHMRLYGVCRHQDRPEIGNALRLEHHQEDMHLMQEMGANAIRLAHYQQADEIYTLADQAGMVVWAEIPFVGPGGYADKGFVDLPAFKENARQQLRELIRQNYNHPSICFWGLFNELKEAGDNPIPFIRELNVLAHQEDTSRPTTSASNQGGDMNLITDLIAWNRYDGWYGSHPRTLAKFLDATHRSHPQLCIGISEYGAGASIYHQQDTLKQPTPTGYWHPENWQTYYHIENWKILNERPFVWGSFVWNMFDFGAAHRHEGDRPGINDKGLVSFDRKTRKDAFYFYKANWNRSEPMLHLAGKRNVLRTAPVQEFMAFTNQPEAELWINGKSQGICQTDKYCIVRWDKVRLSPGKNVVEIRSGKRKTALVDHMELMYNP